MARLTYKIENIFSGLSPTEFFASPGQYSAGIGIDPDLPLSDAAGDVLPSGAIRPSGYATFSSTILNSTPLWLLTNPKNSNLYAYLASGRVVSYDSSLAAGSETNVGTPSSGAGNGSAYYNNYLYFATGTDVSRYGPLDGAAALTDNVWTGSTLGTQTALVNTTYPSMRGAGTMPNHPMHVHINNVLYVADFVSTGSDATTRGRGVIHAIKTTYGSAEGDTDDNSAYNQLDLPLGYMPTDIESYGDFLVISAIQTTNGTINQGKAALFLWDTISPSFTTVVHLADPMVTALLNNNGTLYIFSSPSTGNGYRVSVYAGGQTVKQVFFSEDGSSPLAGAVDAFGDRIFWGTYQQVPTTTPASPEYFATVMAMGSKDNRLPSGIHSIANVGANATSTDGLVTAVKAVEQASFAYPRVVAGWRDGSSTALSKRSTTYGTSIFRTPVIPVGQRFRVVSVRVPLAAAVAANMTITPKIFTDSRSSSTTSGIPVINNTNFANSEQFITFYPDANGNHNFSAELRMSGTALSAVLLPIHIEIETLAD